MSVGEPNYNEQSNHLEGILVLKTKVIELQRAKSQDLGTCRYVDNADDDHSNDEDAMKATMLTVSPFIVFVVVDDQDLAHAPGVWHQEGCIGRALARFLLEPAKDFGLCQY